MLIRAATTEDLPAMAFVNVETRNKMFPGFFPQELLDRVTVEKVIRRWGRSFFDSDTKQPDCFALVAEVDGKVVGELIAGPARDEMVSISGEVYILYVLPQYHHRGIGRSLLAEGARRLQEQGHSAFYLWVLTLNQPSRGFYEAMGGMPVGTKIEDARGYPLDETAYAWLDISLFLNGK